MKPRIRAVLAAILLLALALRGLEARFGLPYLHHFDEPALALRSLQVLRTGDWNPHYFHYPSLLIYLNVGVDVLCYFHLMSQPEDDPETLGSLDDLETGPAVDPWTVSHPSFYLWGRWLTTLFGTLAVLLTFLLTRRLGQGAPARSEGGRSWPHARNELAGLLAALALATFPFHVVHSAYLTTDVPAATLALAVVFFAVRFVQDRRPGDFALSALLVGLAASTKYNLATALAVPAVVLAGARLRRPDGTEGAASSSTPPWLWALLVALPAAGFLAGTPYALLDLRAFLDDAGHEVRHYLVLGHEAQTVEPGWVHLRAELAELTTQAGVWVVVPALAGLAVALRRWVGWVAFLLPVLQLLLTARTSVLFHRNLMILYPFVAVAFGLGTVAVLGWLRRRLAQRGSRWRRALPVAAWTLVALLLAIRTVQILAVCWTTGTRPETRSQAVDVVNAHLATGQPAPTELRIAEELEVHPLDLARLQVPYRVEPLAEIACRPEPGTRVLVPRRMTAGLPSAMREVARLNTLLDWGGPELLAVPGQETRLTHFSTHPGVVLRQPWAWPEGEALPVECGTPSQTVPRPVGGPATAVDGTVALAAGGAAASPFFVAPAGRYLAVWEDRGPGAGLRLRARVVVRSSAEDGETAGTRTIAVETYGSHPEGRRRELPFVLPDGGEVGVRFEALDPEEGAGAATGGGGREMRIRRLWLVPLASEPGG